MVFLYVIQKGSQLYFQSSSDKEWWVVYACGWRVTSKLNLQYVSTWSSNVEYFTSKFQKKLRRSSHCLFFLLSFFYEDITLLHIDLSCLPWFVFLKFRKSPFYYHNTTYMYPSLHGSMLLISYSSVGLPATLTRLIQ